MATKWTDEWVRSLPHPKPGERPVIIPDPVVNGHRLVVRPTVKVFEFQRDRPLQYGPRKTYKVQTGDYLTTTVEQSRTATIEGLARIARGEDPRARSLEPEATLKGAYDKFLERGDVRESTLKNNKNDWKILEPLYGSKTLLWLVEHPADVREEHVRVTKAQGPSAANHAFRTLRAIYNHAASLDTSLPGERDPTSAVSWNKEKPRDAAIPASQLPQWFKQVEAIRAKSPVRGAFHMLCLRFGLRPGELAKAQWSHVDLERKVLLLPVSKTETFEIPLTRQALAELKRLEEAKPLNKPGNDWLFPSRGKDGRLKRLTAGENEDISHSGNCGRHTFATQASLLDISDKLRDILSGRTLIKAGVAGSGYLDRKEFGPDARKAAQKINDRIDKLMGAKTKS